MQFHANGAFDEIWDFGIESAHAGDLYKGCKFSLHYTGQWHWSFAPTFRLVLGTRSPAPAALTGSTCASPALTELAINQAGFVDDVQPSQLFPNVDYSRLIHVTPGKAIWQETQVITRLGQAMHGLSDTVGADQVSLFGSISFGGANVSYIKQ
jgi:hypothetical protein